MEPFNHTQQNGLSSVYGHGKGGVSCVHLAGLDLKAGATQDATMSTRYNTPMLSIEVSNSSMAPVKRPVSR